MLIFNIHVSSFSDIILDTEVNSLQICIFTARTRSVREGNVFSRVCLLVCLSNSGGGGGSHVNFAHDALGHSIAVYKSIMGLVTWDPQK